MLRIQETFKSDKSQRNSHRQTEAKQNFKSDKVAHARISADCRLSGSILKISQNRAHLTDAVKLAVDKVAVAELIVYDKVISGTGTV